MYKGYYMNKMRKEQDKYEGLFSKKQRSDLGNATEVQLHKVSTKQLNKQLRQQKGAGLTFMDPSGRIKKL